MKKIAIASWVTFCCLAMAGHATAQLYKWVDEKGVTHFSDVPVGQGSKIQQYEKKPAQQPKPETSDEEWIKCSDTGGYVNQTAFDVLRHTYKEWSQVKAKDAHFRYVNSGREGAMIFFDVFAYVSGANISRKVTVLFKQHPTIADLCCLVSAKIEDHEPPAHQGRTNKPR